MISKTLTIKNATGLHVRPAGVLVNSIKGFSCIIKIQYNGSEYDAKSILGVMSACIKGNTDVTFITDGSDEQEAMSAIEKGVVERFGEIE